MVVAPNLIDAGTSADGQAEIVRSTTFGLAEQCALPITAVALQLAGQPERERYGELRINRIPPYAGGRDVPYGALYHVERQQEAMRNLAVAAHRASQTLGPDPSTIPALVHGFECGSVARALARRGHPVIGELCYIVAEAVLSELSRRSGWRDPMFYGGDRRLTRGLLRVSHGLSRMLPRLPLPAKVTAMALALQSERLLVEHSHRLLGMGASFTRSLARVYPEAEAKLLPFTPGATPMPTDTALPDRASRDPSAFNVVAAGRADPQKGWDFTAQAMTVLERDNPELAAHSELHTAGDFSHGDPRFIDACRRQLGSLRHIRWRHHGHLHRAEMWRLMLQADVLLMPSRFEPFGLLMLEAMQAGCAVIATDTDGPRGTLVEPWGVIVPRRLGREVPQHLARALARVASADPETKHRRAEAARAAARSYDWRVTAREFADAIAGLSTTRSARSESLAHTETATEEAS